MSILQKTSILELADELLIQIIAIVLKPGLQSLPELRQPHLRKEGRRFQETGARSNTRRDRFSVLLVNKRLSQISQEVIFQSLTIGVCGQSFAWLDSAMAPILRHSPWLQNACKDLTIYVCGTSKIPRHSISGSQSFRVHNT
jgi:hypothetical protein